MQAVITAKQARQITKGRTPLVPVVYEDAIKALESCLTLDDAREWENKADALAAWAKIYHEDKVGRQARALKLLAYRRMGEIAQLLHPERFAKGRRGSLPGTLAALRTAGLSKPAAEAARRLAIMPARQFDALTSADRPPGPIYAAQLHQKGRTPEIQQLFRALSSARSVSRMHDPARFARSLRDGDAEPFVQVARDLRDWCEAFLEERKP